MKIRVQNLNPKFCRKTKCQVPPSPTLLLELYAKWRSLMESNRLPNTLTFDQYFYIWCSSRRGDNAIGLDDGKVNRSVEVNAPQLIDRPKKMLSGVINTLVLLVDFEDVHHSDQRSSAYYEQMLFGDINVFPTGSMAEYYRRISNYHRTQGKTGIDVKGKVYGWIRLPHTSDYYTSSYSGMGNYPRNAQGMAEDAVKAAIALGVDFTGFDALGEGMVTALFIIHAGRGAEETGSIHDIWSLKWLLNEPINVGENLVVKTFLTVPEDCQVGVCAHEWGHLAAKWADFYDTGSIQSHKSNGLGNYCLMASGSWNNGGITPGLPNGMLRMFHNWIEPIEILKSTKNIKIEPAAEGGSIILIRNPKTMKKPGQYIFAEYRRRKSQDHFLTDEGVAIYSVDESIDNVNDEENLAIEIFQADGKNDLSKIYGRGNSGDGADLYPSLIDGKIVDKIGKDTQPSLSLSSKWTGITLQVKGKPGDDAMYIDVTIK